MGKDIILITSALPYVNNVPHLGHIAGTLLPSDIFARYHRLKNNIVIYICGTDDHGSATEVEAIKNNVSPREIVDFFHNVHKNIYNWFDLSFDFFGQTSNSKVHYKVVQELLIKTYINGYITEKEEELPYDPSWNKFLADRFIVGTCKYCGYENARGDQCENCGRLLTAKDLINPKNAITGNNIIFKKSRHLYLNLTKLENDIKKYLEGKKNIFTDLAISMSLAWIKEGLKERSITRDLSFGVPVPYKELWDVTIKKIFNKLDFTSKEKFLYTYIEALRSEGLVINEDEYNKIKEIVDLYWPKVDLIFANHNHFEEYKNKVLYVWYDALIGYISFTIEKVREKYIYEEVKDVNIEDVKEIKDENNELEIDINGIRYKLRYKIEGNILYLSGIDKNFFYLEKILKYIFLNKKVDEIRLDVSWKDFWTKGKIYHFLGKDNIPFHAVFWPGMIIASNNTSNDYCNLFEITDCINISLPYNVVGFSYLTYQGRKISKSQNWGVFGDALLQSPIEKDYWRLYTAYILPINKDTDFLWNEFVEVINKELVNNIGNLTHRVLIFASKNYDGKLDGNYNENIIKDVLKYLEEYHKLMEKVELSLALRKIFELSNYGNQKFQEEKPWEKPEKNKSFIKSMVLLLLVLYTMLYPFTPGFSKRFFEYIDIKIESFEEIKLILDRNPIINIVKKPEPLFNKIDEKLLEELKNKVTKPIITFKGKH